MILLPVIARLTSALDAYSVRIDDAVSLAEIAQAPGNPGRVIYVVPADESASAGASTTTYTEQLVDVGVDVVIVLASGAARGGARNDAEELKEAVKAALIGWGHPAGRSVTVYRSARLISLAPMTLVLRFAVPTRVRVPRTGASDD